MENQRLKKQLSAACQYSFARLVLNFYTFYEICCDDIQYATENKEYLDLFLGLMKQVLDGEGETSAIVQLRDQITRLVTTITADSSCLQVYETVLRQMELRFSPVDEISMTDVSSLVSEVIEWVTEFQDQEFMNVKIQSLISLLPVRLTKQKFYQMLSEALVRYVGAERQNLKDLLCRIRSEAMLDLTLPKTDHDKELDVLLETLQRTDYKALEKDRYQQLTQEIKQAGNRLTCDRDFYLLLQELINDCYVIHLCQTAIRTDTNQLLIAERILRLLADKMLSGDWSDAATEVETSLMELEGWQETAYERYLQLAEGMDTANLNRGALEWKIEMLLSGNHFVDIENYQFDSSIASQEWVTQAGVELMDGMEALFGRLQKPVIRTVMARVLSVVPRVFPSLDQLKDYTGRSLETCSDLSEREVSIRLIREMMVSFYGVV